jgi:hypothetical protein
MLQFLVEKVASYVWRRARKFSVQQRMACVSSDTCWGREATTKIFFKKKMLLFQHGAKR